MHERGVGWVAGTLVGLVPGLLIYVVSYQFVSRSIESWFDVKVEGALAAGVSLASATLEMQATDTATRARSLSAQLAQTPDATAGLVLERIRDQLGASDVLLFAAFWSLSLLPIGIELARRASELDPDIKIMFITGFAAVALNADSQAPKHAKVLSKPVHLRDLVNEVQKMLAA